MGRCGPVWSNIFFTVEWPSFKEILWRLGTLIFSGVAYLIGVVYQLFAAMASARIFSVEQIKSFADRIHVILGVLMVFVILINLFKMVADPEKLTASSGPGTGKELVIKIGTTLALLAAVNFAFEAAYKIQEAIIDDNVIGKLFLGGFDSASNSSSLNDEMKSGGEEVAISILRGFFFPKRSQRDSELYVGDNPYQNQLLVSYISSGEIMNRNNKGTPMTIDAFLDIVRQKGFQELYRVDCDTMENTISFLWPLATLAGLLVVWMLFVYSIDLGVRVVKLGFYQLIAPVPIAMRMVPGKGELYNNWIKEVGNTFADVFIRLAVIFFSVMAIKLVSQTNNLNFWANQTNQPQLVIAGFAYILIILGIILFMKSAPKIISNVLGLGDGSGSNLGIGFGKVRDGYNTLKTTGQDAKRVAQNVRKPISAAREQAKLARERALKKPDRYGNQRSQAVRTVAAFGTGLAGAVAGAAKGVAGAMKGKSRQQILGEIAGGQDRKNRKLDAAGGKYRSYLARSAQDAFAEIQEKRKKKREADRKEYENARAIAREHHSQTVSADQAILGKAIASLAGVASAMNANLNVRDAEKSVISDSAELKSAMAQTSSLEAMAQAAATENGFLESQQKNLTVASLRAGELFSPQSTAKTNAQTELENELKTKYSNPNFNSTDAQTKMDSINVEIQKHERLIRDYEQQLAAETDEGKKQAISKLITSEKEVIVKYEAETSKLQEFFNNEQELAAHSSVQASVTIDGAGNIDLSSTAAAIDSQISALNSQIASATSPVEKLKLEKQVEVMVDYKTTVQAMSDAQIANPSIVFNAANAESQIQTIHSEVTTKVQSNAQIISEHSESKEKEKTAREKLRESLEKTKNIQEVYIKSNEADMRKTFETFVKEIRKTQSPGLKKELSAHGFDISKTDAELINDLLNGAVGTYSQNPDGSISRDEGLLGGISSVVEQFNKLKGFEQPKSSSESKPETKEDGK